MAMSEPQTKSEQEHDEHLAHELKVEAMHHVGHHHPEPLVEVEVERVIKLA
jgi:hypothetical protein